MREDLIARDQTHVVFDDPAILPRDIAPLAQDPRRAPEGIACQQPHEIEQVRTENHHVFTAGAGVLFPEGAQLYEITQRNLR